VDFKLFSVPSSFDILSLRIRGRIGATILLSKKNCGIPYSFFPSLFLFQHLPTCSVLEVHFTVLCHWVHFVAPPVSTNSSKIAKKQLGFQ
jgi:hypothetical protein